MTHDEKILVIQAHKDGIKLVKTNKWRGIGNLVEMHDNEEFDFHTYDYEIKPESKEPTREEITVQWVKDNDVKVGDTIKVIANIEDSEFVKADFLANYKWVVCSIDKDRIYIGKNDKVFGFPVESIQKVTSKIVQFTGSDYQCFWSKVVRDKQSSWCAVVVGFGTEKIKVGSNYYTYDEALEMLEFIDGTPFGKEVWE